MSDFVRVRLPNGREASMPRGYVEGHASGLEVLDEPATNRRGRPLPVSRKGGRPAKPATTVSKEAAKKAASQKSEIPAPPDAITPDEATAPVVTPEEATK